MCTHEQFVQAVRAAALDYADPETRGAASRCKLVYGAGRGSRLRGVTYYGRWCNGHGPEDPDALVEVCAMGQQNLCQLAGTTIHEMGHVVAGHEAGHGKAWKAACKRLGLRRIKASGTTYVPAMFAPALRHTIYGMQKPTDGGPGNQAPTFAALLPPGGAGGSCTAGHGSQGGTSRGKGSGSRLLKVACPGCGCIARMTRKWLDSAGAPTCGCGVKMQRHINSTVLAS